MGWDYAIGLIVSLATLVYLVVATSGFRYRVLELNLALTTSTR